jgi:hypothetical protein
MSVFLNQNDIVLVKKKQKSTGLQRGLDWVNRVAGSTRRVSRVSSPGLAKSRVNLSGRAEFQNYT